jgi:hypothetical protein
MSLLTNEQIEELTLLHDEWWDGNEGFQEYLNEWNEKQTGVQVNVDWGKAPECAERAEVNFYWVDKNGVTFCVYKEYYNRPEPVITPHPHAEILAKYAEVAARRIDPWMEFEIFSADGEQWVTSKSHLQFHACCKYRHIGETK